MIEQNTTDPEVVVCPWAFRYGGIDTGFTPVPDENFTGATAVTCGYLRDDVSDRMITLGLSILYQYFLFRELFAPFYPLLLLNSYGLSPVAPRSWSKLDGFHHVENRVWFANELFWTLRCGRPFESQGRFVID